MGSFFSLGRKKKKKGNLSRAGRRILFANEKPQCVVVCQGKYLLDGAHTGGLIIAYIFTTNTCA